MPRREIPPPAHYIWTPRKGFTEVFAGVGTFSHDVAAEQSLKWWVNFRILHGLDGKPRTWIVAMVTADESGCGKRHAFTTGIGMKRLEMAVREFVKRGLNQGLAIEVFRKDVEPDSHAAP